MNISSRMRLAGTSFLVSVTALAEEIAAAARSLHQQAERLGEAVAVWSGQR